MGLFHPISLTQWNIPPALLTISNIEDMLRFSDRLTSTSSILSGQSKSVTAERVSSDDTPKSSTTASDEGYVTLVKLVGLHLTVKVLEDEYNLVSGGCKLDLGYSAKLYMSDR